MSTYPYRTDALEHLHPHGWADIPARPVAVATLRPTQDCVVIERLAHLLDGGEPETGDPHPHVIAHDGALYVHDGHHRYVLALAAGAPTITARVVDESGRAA